MHSTTFEVVAMAAFMLAFNSSYAGVFWVLISEMFSMTSKAPAVSAGTAMLFTAGQHSRILVQSAARLALAWTLSIKSLMYRNYRAIVHSH